MEKNSPYFMNETFDSSNIKKKSLRGVTSLLFQTFLIQIIVVVSTLFQAAYLSEVDFGVFAIASTIISFLSYFTDIGLAGALIQKKDLTKNDLTTTFTIQQILCTLVLIIGLLLSPIISIFYRLNNQGVLLFQVLFISFYVSSFKTIPHVLLERKLDFHKLVIPQIIETIIYYVLLTLLMIKGFGLQSIMYAAVFRSVIGLVVIYILSPWKITLGINLDTLKQLFKFGIPYQANSFIAMAKDDILFLVLGRLLPLSGMGYINLAKKISDMPIRMVIDSVSKVTFPAFSRMQEDKEILTKALENTTFGIACMVLPIYISAMFLIEPVISLFPAYAKWQPALLTFYMLAIVAIFSSFSTPFINGLSAIGKISITSKFMVFWTISTWILVIPLVLIFGFNGFALGLMIVSSSVVIVVKVVQKFIPFAFLKNIQMPFLGSFLLILWYLLIIPFIKHNTLLIFCSAFAGVMIYLLFIGYFERKRINFLVKGFLGR